MTTMKLTTARRNGLRTLTLPIETPEKEEVETAEMRSTPNHCPVCGCAVDGDLSGHRCPESFDKSLEDSNRDVSYQEAMGL